MKTAKTIRIFILITILFTILYLFFASKPLSKEYQFTPVWNINTSYPVVKTSQLKENPVHFHLGQTIGYFDSEGTITHYKSFPFQIIIMPFTIQMRTILRFIFPTASRLEQLKQADILILLMILSM